MKRPITIIGGGLAGLALGIGLRRNGIPVTIREAGGYPRHKVCGEFISGAGEDCLRRLSVSSLLEDAGARAARTVAFFGIRTGTGPRALPRPALCVSRHTMDHLLSNHFADLGGDLKVFSPWKKPPLPGMVRASGRRACPTDQGWRWFGLKVHATDVALDADLEMHFLADGYVGLCRLHENRVNVCGLFRNRPGSSKSDAPGADRLRGPIRSMLHHRLKDSRFVPTTFCSVAGLGLRPCFGSSDEFRIGDAFTMIPPITGNGMSIALESARIAEQALGHYSEGAMSWMEAQALTRKQLRRAFHRRLQWARILHRLLFTPGFQFLLLASAAKSRLAFDLSFSLTR